MRGMVLIISLSLLIGCAHVGAKDSEPWEVWAHSEKQEECIVKTVFWFAVIIGTVYVITKYCNKRWGWFEEIEWKP